MSRRSKEERRAEFEKIIAQYSSETSSSNSDDERDEKERNKWRLIIKTLDWRRCLKSNPAEVHSRVKNGISNSTRSFVWQLISGGRNLLLANRGIYSRLLSNEISADSVSEEVIVQDVHRTLPALGLYGTIDGPSHRSLYNVLKAYSVYDREVGYTQGMNYIAGMILIYMDEEEAFWVMVALLKGMGIRGLFLEGLPLLHQCFFQLEMLVKEQLPELAKHFEEQKITPMLYASGWFMTAFSSNLPFALVVRIWDVFLFEGMKAVFEMGLALLKFFHDDLLKFSFDSLLPFLQNFPAEALDVNTLISMGCSLTLRPRIEELELDYRRSNNQSSGSRENSNGGRT